MSQYFLIKNDKIINVISLSDPEKYIPIAGCWILEKTSDRGWIGWDVLPGNVIVPPKPYDSWVYNETTGYWDAPIPIPDEENTYEWNETSQVWVLINIDGGTEIL